MKFTRDQLYVHGEERVLWLWYALLQDRMSLDKSVEYLAQEYPNHEVGLKILKRLSETRTYRQAMEFGSIATYAMTSTGNPGIAAELTSQARNVINWPNTEEITEVFFLELLAFCQRCNMDLPLVLQTLEGFHLESARVKEIIASLADGLSLGCGLRSCGNFSPEALLFVDLGEHTGMLPECLMEIAKLKLAYMALAPNVPPGKFKATVVHTYIAGLAMAGFEPNRIILLAAKYNRSFDPLVEKVYRGASLADTLAMLPNLYPAWAISLVASSTRADELAAAFSAIAKHFQFEVLGILPTDPNNRHFWKMRAKC